MANENQNNDSAIMTPGEVSDTLGFNPSRKPVKDKEPEMTLGQLADDIDSTKKMRANKKVTEEE